MHSPCFSKWSSTCSKTSFDGWCKSGDVWLQHRSFQKQQSRTNHWSTVVVGWWFGLVFLHLCTWQSWIWPWTPLFINQIRGDLSNCIKCNKLRFSDKAIVLLLICFVFFFHLTWTFQIMKWILTSGCKKYKTQLSSNVSFQWWPNLFCSVVFIEPHWMILDTLMQKFGSISISDIRIAVMADNDMYRYNICSLNISTLIKKKWSPGRHCLSASVKQPTIRCCSTIAVTCPDKNPVTVPLRSQNTLTKKPQNGNAGC